MSDVDRALLVDRGVLPWWTHPHLTIRFFRPLSSVLRWVDFAVLDAPWLHHLHSFVWWAALVCAARALYARWLSPRATWIATFVFGLAPCHAIPISWLANREVLVSLAFGVLGLGALARFRETGAGRHALLALSLFTCAMLGGEYAFALGGYVVAFELFAPVAGRSGARRAAALGTFGVPFVAVMIARRTLGFTNAGSGFYRDPFVQTQAFLESTPRRLARLFVDAWLASDADWIMETRAWLLVPAIVLLAVGVMLPVRRTLAGTDDATRGAARAFLLGSLLALVPMVSVAPNPRLLGPAVLGVGFVVGLTLEHGWFSRDAAALRGRPMATLMLLLGFFQLVHGPITGFFEALLFRRTATAYTARAAWLRDRVGDDARDADIVVARCSWQTVLFQPFALEPDSALPRRWWVLSLAPHALMLRRDEQTVELVVPRGFSYFPTGPDDLFRSDDLPFHAGDVVTVPGLRVTILDPGSLEAAARVRFDFDKKIESLVWIADGAFGWRDAPPPRVGLGMPLDP